MNFLGNLTSGISNSNSKTPQIFKQSVLQSISLKNSNDNKMQTPTIQQRNVTIPALIQYINSLQLEKFDNYLVLDILSKIVSKIKLDKENGKILQMSVQEIKLALNEIANMPNLGNYNLSNAFQGSINAGIGMAFNNFKPKGGKQTRRRYTKKNMNTKRRNKY
jgi:hypothetical protein